MKIGSVMFVKSSSPISYIIRKMTKSDWSHVALYISPDWIIESDVFKRLKVRQNKYLQYEVVDVGLTDTQRLQLLSYVLEHTNSKYDYSFVIGIGLKLLGLIKDENIWNMRNRFMCSEILDLAYSSVGVDLVKCRKDGNVTPADIANSVLKRNAICKCK